MAATEERQNTVERFVVIGEYQAVLPEILITRLCRHNCYSTRVRRKRCHIIIHLSGSKKTLITITRVTSMLRLPAKGATFDLGNNNFV
jgi:IS30 family transposase